MVPLASTTVSSSITWACDNLCVRRLNIFMGPNEANVKKVPFDDSKMPETDDDYPLIDDKSDVFNYFYDGPGPAKL